MKTDEWEVVNVTEPYKGVKQTNKYDYFGLFIRSSFRNKVSGLVKTYTEMLELHRIKERERNKYA